MNHLAKLELTDRWRLPRIELLDKDDLERLADATLERLFVSEDGVDLLYEEDAPDEVINLIELMIWAYMGSPLRMVVPETT